MNPCSSLNGIDSSTSAYLDCFAAPDENRLAGVLEEVGDQSVVLVFVQHEPGAEHPDVVQGQLQWLLVQDFEACHVRKAVMVDVHGDFWLTLDEQPNPTHLEHILCVDWEVVG